jgi:DNA-binding XRE family transcriptional regulator
VNHLTQLRIKAGLDKKQAAKLIGITVKTLERYELGKVPASKVGYQMARTYGTSMEQIYRPFYEGD